MAKIIIVDDELTMVQMVTELLRAEGHEVFPFTNGVGAIDCIETEQPDLVITDLYLDKTSAFGLEILKKARSLSPPCVVIVITAFGSIETAKEAMKLGAYDYLEKPFNLEEFKLCVQRSLTFSDTISENLYLKKVVKKKYQFTQIVGDSPQIQNVVKMIERIADTDCTVLILGESGTGKELIARALHFNSKRRLAQFVPINCSALPEYLLESELFGHRKGAFTGAIRDKKGLFEEADGGTIFLDEIGTMPPVLQSRLLRVLQEGEMRRVGDNAPVYVNVRVVAATNEPLEKLVKEGKFRGDLYYRLNVIPIILPPLRERKEDIPLLVAHFLKDKIHSATGNPFRLTKTALEALKSYNYPGNVRELENAIERACALSETEVIKFNDLPPIIQQYAKSVGIQSESPEDIAALPTERLKADEKNTSPTIISEENKKSKITEFTVKPLKDFLKEKEREYLNRVLSITGGDKEKAATMLGVSMATLYRKLSEDD
jgi:DNA-binding NtrC family response regulator